MFQFPRSQLNSTAINLKSLKVVNQKLLSTRYLEASHSSRISEQPIRTMSDLLKYILTQDSFRKYSKHTPALHKNQLTNRRYARNRLPSLYSDFSTQKKTNPDGYHVNATAWEQALVKAARNGYIASSSGSSPGSEAAQKRKSNHLVLRVDDGLVRDLESPQLGRPVALGSVFVCSAPLFSCF
jgi:hypothetical protein